MKGIGSKGARVPGYKAVAPKATDRVCSFAFDASAMRVSGGDAVGVRRGIVALSTYQVGDFARQLLGQVIHR